MHNIKIIRKDPKFFKKKLSERNVQLDLTNLLDLDKKNRELIQNREKLEQEKKIISQKKDSSKFEESKQISKKIEEKNKDEIKLKKEIEKILISLPNIAILMQTFCYYLMRLIKI